MRKLVPLLMVLVTACSGASLTDGPTLDLTEPDTLALIGLEEPEFSWRRDAGAIEVVGVDVDPRPAEIETIAAAFAELPRAVLDAADPRLVVRTRTGGGLQPTHADAQAFVLGPDVYLLDTLFADSISGSRLNVARAVTHELAHVAQFAAVDSEYVEASLNGSVKVFSPTDGSELVRDFAASVGWSNASDDPLAPDWQLGRSSTPPTEYAATDPAEDMAESLSLVALGRADLVSASRVRWIEDWLGTTAERLAEGKPWAPPGSSEIFSSQAIFDESAVAEMRANARAEHAEPLYFQLAATAPRHPQVVTEINVELSGRGLLGVLEPMRNEDRLPRYGGLFRRADGVQIWVELWDFRESDAFRNAPDAAILTYVVLW